MQYNTLIITTAHDMTWDYANVHVHVHVQYSTQMGMSYLLGNSFNKDIRPFPSLCPLMWSAGDPIVIAL